MSSSNKYLAVIKELYKGYAAAKNFQKTAGMCRVVSVDKGRVQVEFDVSEEHTNPLGTLHGGMTASLVDIVTSTAVRATGRENVGVTVDLTVSYLAPARIGDTVIVDGSVTKMGRSMAYTRADLRLKSDDSIIATALHTKAFPLMRPPPK
ncbi:thioesterase superfamily domain-containing protein [Ditylenchus destructor]|uniref:Acyl-coenzyme A thioesterase 13 n=1 Tax=Ditylenchus destructor TaxID=166010 RepID=A0AAD4N092_9BILA|nr:thioesterase superfamily domain-containing protein [Ditylenchus destructor]